MRRRPILAKTSRSASAAASGAAIGGECALVLDMCSASFVSRTGASPHDSVGGRRLLELARGDSAAKPTGRDTALRITRLSEIHDERGEVSGAEIARAICQSLDRVSEPPIS